MHAQLPLPDPSSWQPASAQNDNLKNIFSKVCLAAEERILHDVQFEKSTRRTNLSSGLPVEAIVRKAVRDLIPRRYMVNAGIIDDSEGKTSGEHDLVVFNDLWFPHVKPGQEEAGRDAHFPIEGIYAVAEIKQTLDLNTLDSAMEKLVRCSRLRRAKATGDRVVENRRVQGTSCLISNPLHTAVIATGLAEDVSFGLIEDRFLNINAMLPRLQNVRCLCVLGEACVNWTWLDDGGSYRPAYFQGEDLFHPIVPVLTRYSDGNSTFFPFITDLLLHLYQSILAAEDIAAEYGGLFGAVPPSHATGRLDPDKDLLNCLGSDERVSAQMPGGLTRQAQEERIKAIYKSKYGEDIELRPGPLPFKPSA